MDHFKKEWKFGRIIWRHKIKTQGNPLILFSATTVHLRVWCQRCVLGLGFCLQDCSARPSPRDGETTPVGAQTGSDPKTGPTAPGSGLQGPSMPMGSGVSERNPLRTLDWVWSQDGPPRTLGLKKPTPKGLCVRMSHLSFRIVKHTERKVLTDK